MLKIESKNNGPNNVEGIREAQTYFTEYASVKAEALNNNSIVLDGPGAEPLPEAKLDNGKVVQELIGMLLIDDRAVGIIKASKAGKTRYIITKIDSEGKKFTFVDVLKPDHPLILGRDNIGKENNYISRHHAEISLNEDAQLTIKDSSANGTIFISNERVRDDNNDKSVTLGGLKKIFKKQNSREHTIEINHLISNPKNWGVYGVIPSLVFEDDASGVNGDEMWDYTRIPTEETSRGSVVKGYEEPYVDLQGQRTPAHYLDRPVINRDSEINGGVYFVPGIQEAIVVDDGTKPKRGAEKKPMNVHYERAFNDFIRVARSRGVDVLHGVKDKDASVVLGAALDSVMDIIKYDVKVAETAEKLYADRKVNLDSFIGNGRGVCRHQALLVGYLLERIINAGYLSGEVSVDRNVIRGKGGHAWTRYVSSDGTVYIIDPAQNYVGTLKDSINNSNWSYRRPNER